ncbi:MAG: acyl-CoA dehydrogenase family protein [Hyphomicrobiaceae bacterium]
MSEAADDSIVVDTTTRIFKDLADPLELNKAKDESWKAPLWQALEEAGLPLAWVPDELGGSGASIGDGFDVLRVAGRSATPVPLAETLIAGWLLARAGIAAPAGIMTVAPVTLEGGLTLGTGNAVNGVAMGVPFASEAGHIVAVAGSGKRSSVALLEAKRARISKGQSLAGDAKCEVAFENASAVAVGELETAVGASPVALIGAAARAMQMAGALESALEMATTYAKERIAFERTIGQFQAVQHNLAKLAGETAAALAVAGSAADTLAAQSALDDSVFLEVASAKIRVGEAAGAGAAIAHQVHGAIGFTLEHALQRLTRRLWAWRDEFGTESEWAVLLGNKIAAEGADQLWPTIAAR